MKSIRDNKDSNTNLTVAEIKFKSRLPLLKKNTELRSSWIFAKQIKEWDLSTISSAASEQKEIVFYTSFLVYFLLQQGHSSVDMELYSEESLAEILLQYLPDDGENDIQKYFSYFFPTRQKWEEKIRYSPLFSLENPSKKDQDHIFIISEKKHIYLHKIWYYEQFIAKNFYSRTFVKINRSLGEEIAPQSSDNDSSSKTREKNSETENNKAKKINDNLFLSIFAENPYEQDLSAQGKAAWHILENSTLIIGGGPGTGKTTSVKKIIQFLALVHWQTFQDNSKHSYGNLDTGLNPNLEKEEFIVFFAAPTGKAAKRLQESVSDLQEDISKQTDLYTDLHIKVSTIHRLLAFHSHPSRPAFNRDKPLSCHVLVIDEASMIDTVLWKQLLEALSPQSKLIVLGDPMQLASVNAGSVFQDLIRFFSQMPISRFEKSSTKSSNPLIQFNINYRLSSDSSLLLLKEAIEKGDKQALAESLFSGQEDGSIVIREALDWQDYEKNIIRTITANWKNIYNSKAGEKFKNYRPNASDSIKTYFQIFSSFSCLSFFRHGPFGSKNINNIMRNYRQRELLLCDKGNANLIEPIIISENSYSKELYNGDTGFLYLAPNQTEGHAFFLNYNNEINSLRHWQIPEYETAYAITVHRSQGSEYEEILIVLPMSHYFSDFLSKELLYTAVTRARKRIIFLGDIAILERMALNPGKRSSGFSHILTKTFLDIP